MKKALTFPPDEVVKYVEDSTKHHKEIQSMLLDLEGW
jgi:hypothetical protein